MVESPRIFVLLRYSVEFKEEELVINVPQGECTKWREDGTDSGAVLQLGSCTVQ